MFFIIGRVKVYGKIVKIFLKKRVLGVFFWGYECVVIRVDFFLKRFRIKLKWVYRGDVVWVFIKSCLRSLLSF